jgi:hypothetical protein
MGCLESSSIKNEFTNINLENSQSIMSINKFFKEIVVVDGFEIENGLLGLDRDNYLSIVKFLDSLMLRKVCVNVFFFF